MNSTEVVGLFRETVGDGAAPYLWNDVEAFRFLDDAQKMFCRLTGGLGDASSAITQLASDRATIGAYQSRLNLTSEQLVVSKENLSAASSRIQDTDVAEESTQFARYNILVQSGTAMLAQANQLPQSVLRLLQ